jgi:leucyl/phenylalanyl-tRNA---protein transferase
MAAAYDAAARLGFAHSVEVWDGDTLAGGLYGVALGRVFFAESMFSRATNASKAAMVFLAQELCSKGFELIDCQLPSRHLATMGAVETAPAGIFRAAQQARRPPQETRRFRCGRRDRRPIRP